MKVPLYKYFGKIKSLPTKTKFPTRTLSSLRELGVFFVSIFMTAAANVLVLPMVISHLGPQYWSQIAAAQAAGALAGSVTLMGWGVSGPALIAGKAASDHLPLVKESLRRRAPVFVISQIAACSFVCLTFNANQVTLSLVAVGSGFTGLSLGWVFIGLSSAWRLLVFETLPRAAGQIVGVFALSLIGNPLVFAIVSLAGNLASVPMSYSTLRRKSQQSNTFNVEEEASTTSDVTPSNSREPIHSTLASWISLIYLSVPILLVTQLWPSQLPQYALFERIWRTVSSVFRPVSQVFQGWIPRSPDMQHILLRVKVASTLVSALAVLVSLGTFLFYKSVGLALSSGLIQLSSSFCITGAIILASTLISQTLGLACLTSLKRTNLVTQSAGLGLLVGFITYSLLDIEIAGQRIGTAVCFSEIAVVVFQATSVWLLGRKIQRNVNI